MRERERVRETERERKSSSLHFSQFITVIFSSKAKDAVRIAKLRQTLAKRSLRQRMQAESLKAERIRAEREAKHAVADVEAAVEEANTALKSLKRVAGDTEGEYHCFIKFELY